MSPAGPSPEFFASLTRTCKTRDGREILIRPIRPEDAKIEWQFVHDLSPVSRYQRFLSALRDLTPAMVETFTRVDYGRNMALIATAKGKGDAKEFEIAVGRYVADRDGRGCEFALAVADDWQDCGVGYQILTDLIQAARRQGIGTMRGLVFATNSRMIRLIKDLGFAVVRSAEDATVVEAVMDLAPPDGTPPTRTGT
ncbi:MAG TPA: GNAT family N-acetyltransferase [bacterium]|nr:GNAT family N-acetyltransferase [bacterium]